MTSEDEKKDVIFEKKKTKTPREVWEKIIEDQEKSGLGVSKYCSIKNIDRTLFFGAIARKKMKQKIKNAELLNEESFLNIKQRKEKNESVCVSDILFFNKGGIYIKISSECADENVKKFLKLIGEIWP